MSNEYVKSVWEALATRLELAEEAALTFWQEIEAKYESTGRYYHNLAHLEAMLKAYGDHEAEIETKDALLLSVYFHDLIYNPMRKDNELKSAERMKVLLGSTPVSKEIIDTCYRQILQTKEHQLTEKSKRDDAFFLDFDLEVLSRSWPEYQEYATQIRKEYWMYPKLLYNKGRRAAMTKFLERDQIYFTEIFQTKKEATARANMKREIEEVLKG